MKKMFLVFVLLTTMVFGNEDFNVFNDSDTTEVKQEKTQERKIETSEEKMKPSKKGLNISVVFGNMFGNNNCNGNTNYLCYYNNGNYHYKGTLIDKLKYNHTTVLLTTKAIYFIKYDNIIPFYIFDNFFVHQNGEPKKMFIKNDKVVILCKTNFDDWKIITFLNEYNYNSTELE